MIERWCKLFKGPLLVQRYLAHEDLPKPERDAVSDIAEVWRKRLFDISWFTRCLNEPIARESNREDNYTGRFWEGRFKSQALLDESALLSCMAYVELNPIRAGMNSILEDSDFTSIKEKLYEFASGKKHSSRDQCAPAPELNVTKDKSRKHSSRLVKCIGDENKEKPADGIHFSEVDYFELVDWTGRVVREDKRGSIPSHVLPLLEKLNASPDVWLV